MICKKCGKEIKDTAKFCGYCGCANIYDITNVDFREENIAIKSVTIKQSAEEDVKTEISFENLDIKSEIRQNAVIFAMPVIYLIWQIVRHILSVHFLGMGIDAYVSFAVAAYYIGNFLFGTINGGLTVVVRNCTKKFRLIYLLPYILVCTYFFVSSINNAESIVTSVFEFLEIIVSMVVITLLQNTRIFNIVSLKSTVIIAAVSTMAYVIFSFLSFVLRAIIFGASMVIDFTYIISIVISAIGAVIGATIAYYWKSKKFQTAYRGN